MPTSKKINVLSILEKEYDEAAAELSRADFLAGEAADKEYNRVMAKLTDRYTAAAKAYTDLLYSKENK
jgi:hypothetical protein